MAKAPRWTPEQLAQNMRNNPHRSGLVGQNHLYAMPLVNEKKANRKIRNATKTVLDGLKTNHLKLEISGQIIGGKNNYIVTRKGKHVPQKRWALWRDRKVQDVRWQLPPKWTPISTRCDVHLFYWAGDRRKRDQPAIIDSLWHVLGKAGVVEDDNLLWVVESLRSEDLENPRVELHLYW